jgi:hypothetical protein
VIHIFCLVASSEKEVSLTWARGPDAFDPYRFTRAARDDLAGAAERARSAFENVLECWLRRAEYGEDEYRTNCSEFAAAGFELRQAIFSPDKGADLARDVADWLAAVRTTDPDCCVEFVADGPVNVPWNFAYDRDPAGGRFDPAAPTDWEPFWAIRYNAFGGQRVDPRRRTPVWGRSPRLLLVAERLVLDGLPEHDRAGLAEFAGRHGVPVLGSRAELEVALKAGRPDLLYWLGHTRDNALQLGDDALNPTDLYRLLQKAGRDDVPRGLVFLNSCRTTTTGSDRKSFLDTVASLRMSGLVGTEQLTVDTFAGSFGLDFLTAFCEAGEPVGAIMARLRRQVPLGLVYTACCPPELRVARADAAAPVPEVRPTDAVAPATAKKLGFETPAAPPQPLPARPYPSLNYYDREHRALFAGRDDDIVRFAHILDEAGTRVLILHGESGSGKSSFLRAGVVPYLEDECVGYRFARDHAGGAAGPVLFVRATADLASQLADALCTFAARPLELRRPSGSEYIVDLPGLLAGVTGGRTDAAGVRAALAADPGVLGRALAAFAARLPFRVVLVVDQAEEVFTLARADDTANQILALAILREAAAAGGDFKLVVSLRTEYYGRLVDRLRSGVRAAAGVREYLLTDLDTQALTKAITRPTVDVPIRYAGEVPFAKYGFEYAEGVAERIAVEVVRHTTGRQDSVLPLAQVMCGQLYDRIQERADRVVRAEDLAAIGGVAGGMKRHAEGLVARLLPSQWEASAFKRLLTDLYRRQPDGTLTTDLVRESELAKRWRGRTRFTDVLGAASSGGWRLLRVANLRVGGEASNFVSLGNDALAPVAQEWQGEFDRWRSTRRWLGWAAVIVVALLAGLTAISQYRLALEQKESALKQRELALKQEEIEREAKKSKTELLAQSFLNTESDALWQLACLNGAQEDVRLETFSRTSRDGQTLPAAQLARKAAQVSQKLDLIVHAAIGLDGARRDTVLSEFVLPALRDATSPAEVKWTAVEVGAILAFENPEFIDHALKVTAEAPPERVSLGNRRFAGFLDERLLHLAIDQGRLQDLLDARREATKRDPGSLAAALARVAGRLGAKDAADTDRWLIGHFREAAVYSDVLRTLRDALIAVSRQLDPNDARVTPRRLLEQAYTEKKFGNRRMDEMLELFSAAGRIDPNDAATATARLTEALEAPDGRKDEEWLARALVPVVDHLSAEDAKKAADRLFEWFEKEVEQPSGQRARELLADALGRSLKQLDQGAADQAVERLLRLFKQKRIEPPLLAGALTAVAGRLGPADAAAVTNWLVESIQQTDYDTDRQRLAKVLSAVADQLDPKDAQEVTRGLLERFKAAPTGKERQRLAETLAAVACRFDPQDAKKAVDACFKRLQESNDSQEWEGLAGALKAMLPRLAPMDSWHSTRLLLGFYIVGFGKNDTHFVCLMAEILAAVSPPSPDQDAVHASMELFSRLERENDSQLRQRLTTSLCVVARHLEPRTARMVMDRGLLMATQARSQSEKEGLIRAAVTAWGQDQFTDDKLFERELLKRLLDTAEFEPSDYLPNISPVLEAARPEAGRKFLADLLRHPQVTSLALLDEPRRRGVRGALTKLPLGTELHEHLEFLKAPTCVGVLREAVLTKVGGLVGEEFRTVWDFEAWARANRSDLDFASPPSRDP